MLAQYKIDGGDAAQKHQKKKIKKNLWNESSGQPPKNFMGKWLEINHKSRAACDDVMVWYVVNKY